MTSIKNYKHSTFLWDNKAALLPASLALPIALQGISFAIKIFNQPNILSNKLENTKQFLKSSFSIQKGETEGDFKKRAIVNVLTAITLSQAVAWSTIGAVILLPPSFGIPIALSILFFTFDVVTNLEKYSIHWLKVKTWIKETFLPRLDETPQAAALRITRNTAIISVIGALMIWATLALPQAIAEILQSSSITIWNPQSLLPMQTPLVVFMEYAALGLLHGGLALKKFEEGKSGEAIFHLVNFMLGMFFPCFYLLDTREPIRLHHSFLGLLISLAPSNTLKLYGSLTTLDSLAYVAYPLRGFWNGSKWKHWDFQNLVVENYHQFFGAFFTALAAETTNNSLS